MKMSLCLQFKSTVAFLFILDFQQAGIKAIPPPPIDGADCSEIFAKNQSSRSQVYYIRPSEPHGPFWAYCEMQDGGWTVIQRRNGKGADGTPVNFARNWADYKRGFGTAKYEHWLGLEQMHLLSNQVGKTCQLKIDMVNCNEEEGYAFYDSFRIGSEQELYSIHLGSYTGNTGDAFRGTYYSRDQNHHPFSTYDSDNDDCYPCIRGDIAFNSCANEQYSAWWFSDCGMVDLNGMWHPKTDCTGWASGVYWKTWQSYTSLLSAVLKVRCK
nr:fibrinogen-like protein 1 [Pogona vitticeps]